MTGFNSIHSNFNVFNTNVAKSKNEADVPTVEEINKKISEKLNESDSFIKTNTDKKYDDSDCHCEYCHHDDPKPETGFKKFINNIKNFFQNLFKFNKE